MLEELVSDLRQKSGVDARGGGRVHVSQLVAEVDDEERPLQRDC